MTELQKQLADLARFVSAAQAKLEQGELPEMCDARLIRGSASFAEQMIWRAHLDLIRSVPERTAEEDKAAQRYLDKGAA